MTCPRWTAEAAFAVSYLITGRRPPPSPQQRAAMWMERIRAAEDEARAEARGGDERDG